ncbi:serine/threonine protein kinase [Sphingomonas sp. Leaf33]|uniref:type II toxin-antitoxin system HipA family toxin n=1 Tax=Sphingomonas sp. Leaf33 TaxID=1736215 RepID=UPI0006FC3CCC|nr:type II toxin-antitoxin system HipA family toxin [Sphingomonas sp. Leaf33]KQN25232.1 serine/threonine protein kinase [Sphingomonas sp. Leaf33]
MNELVVLLDAKRAGVVRYANDRLSFSYDDAWRADPDAYPLSLSMPLALRDHDDLPIRAFIWNLLPDNDRTLDRWARQFHVSARNPFRLIAAVGEDCAGAVQFVMPERADVLIAEGPDSGDVAWIDEAEVARRLRSVLDDAASGRTAGDNGQFSLAGAQPKTALLFEDGRWGIPSGRIPTTHILKPPARALPGHAENEHFCLNLARRMGLRAARSQVRGFEDQLAIVVTRYDRVRLPGESWVRLHQEDMCQALGVLPQKKYQNEGGPGPEAIVALLREQGSMAVDGGDMADADVDRFVDALMFNWLIAGTDAHAKNYSLLIGGLGTVVLAPLYDIASAFGLADIAPQKMKLAMKINDYPVARVLPHHWQEWSERVGLESWEVLNRLFAMAESLPAAIDRVAAEMRGEGLDHPVIDRLATILTDRAKRIAAMG